MIELLKYKKPTKPNERVDKLFTKIGWFANPSEDFTPEQIMLTSGVFTLEKIANGLAFYK